jgi:RNA polymerase sigma-70 factor (ECF subfamily)
MEAGMMEEAMVGSVRLGRLEEIGVVRPGKALSDGEIIESVKQGDRDSYREIVDRYKQRAYHMALALVGDPQDALDMSQSAFIKAYRNIRRFDAGRPFLPWFYRILRNLCLDHIRRSKRRHEVPLSEALILQDASAEGEMQLALRRAIETLDAEHREVVMLHYFEGFSYREMASTLGKPMGTIMSTLYQARQKLKAALRGARTSSQRGD